MLLPKRTKFRKQFRGKNRGIATTGNKVSFGEFGLKSLERGEITSRQIESARRARTSTSSGDAYQDRTHTLTIEALDISGASAGICG